MEIALDGIKSPSSQQDTAMGDMTSPMGVLEIAQFAQRFA